MEKNTLIAHVRDANNVIHATVACVDGKFGVSVRNKTDQVSKKLGRDKAIGRAKSRFPKLYVNPGTDHYLTVIIKGRSYNYHINLAIDQAITYLKGRWEKLQEN